MTSQTRQENLSLPYTFDLYTYFRSSCSARLRIALHYKGIAFNSIPVNLLKGEQTSDAHRAVNPGLKVPVLVVHDHTHQQEERYTITQSLAALEFLEEITASTIKPEKSLLPSNPKDRATARSLAQLIASDLQPITNLHIQIRVRDQLHGDSKAWSHDLTVAGLTAYETLVVKTAGKFSVGDQLTVADVCLLPAVWNAYRCDIDVQSTFPVIWGITERMEKEVEAVKLGHWRGQEDTPEEFREGFSK
jgi:maleylacetoacetate isomerase